MHSIDFFSFEPTEDPDKNGQPGTVEVTLRGETRRLRARKPHPGPENNRQGEITAYGIAIRYPTSTKVWRGYLKEWTCEGELRSAVGGYERRLGSFQPPSIVGFIEKQSGQPTHKRDATLVSGHV